MDGQIIRQSSSYRHGLVLGLTMAEIMILLVFCLLIAMTAFLRIEQVKTDEAAQRFQIQQAARQANRERDIKARRLDDDDRRIIRTIERNSFLVEKLRSAAASSNSDAAIDEFWRELVEGQTFAAELKSSGLSRKDLHDKIAEMETLRSKGIDLNKALRDADVVSTIRKVMPGAGDPSTSPQSIADAVERGIQQQAGGHQWPPIITLSEAAGYFFKTGSAELSAKFRDELLTSTPDRIVSLIKQYDVDVVEVVGHTDEQPLGDRQSNLDRDLLPVLRNEMNITSLVPSDNAGLGLARAVSVISVLRQSKMLTGYKLIPLSGAQLINTDETLAVTGTPGDIPERRRIEIRLRKSDPTARAQFAPTPSPKPSSSRPRSPSSSSPRPNVPPASSFPFFR